ncbi:RPOLA_N domain-containing protein [Trichonephila clavipes]|nr:RPOLA_N domain-containing protein [Trichonephila clavipes]
MVQAMNTDFDGDECNLYLVPNVLSQAECATILNREFQLGCFVMQGLKLTPTRDMLVMYFSKFKDIPFLPYKQRDLSKTFQVLYDCYGSQQTFKYIDQMRQFYLDVLQRQMCFALTLQEMQALYEWGRESLEVFQQKTEMSSGCLVTQVLSGAKGSFENLYQKFGSIGCQNEVFVKHSFWEGLRANEAAVHAKMATEALSNASKIWEPGYSYYKMVYNLQGLYGDYKERLTL